MKGLLIEDLRRAGGGGWHPFAVVRGLAQFEVGEACMYVFRKMVLKIRDEQFQGGRNR